MILSDEDFAPDNSNELHDLRISVLDGDTRRAVTRGVDLHHEFRHLLMNGYLFDT